MARWTRQRSASMSGRSFHFDASAARSATAACWTSSDRLSTADIATPERAERIDTTDHRSGTPRSGDHLSALRIRSSVNAHQAGLNLDICRSWPDVGSLCEQLPVLATIAAATPLDVLSTRSSSVRRSCTTARTRGQRRTSEDFSSHPWRVTPSACGGWSGSPSGWPTKTGGGGGASRPSRTGGTPPNYSLCLHDRRRLPAQVLDAVVRTYPLTWSGHAPVEAVAYEDSQRFLRSVQPEWDENPGTRPCGP